MADFLSHPEILPVDKLRDILTSRGIPGKELVDKDKNDLVLLFYRFIVPLPQRTNHMRRANRRRRNLTDVTSSADRQEGECNSRGIKRKSNSSEMDKTSQTKEVLNFLHDSITLPSNSSSTTECRNRITNLSVNCQVSKPLKLNRECLHVSKQNNCVLKAKILNCTEQSETSATMKQEFIQTSNKNNSQCIKEEDTHNTAKKFRRITVTWP